MKNPFGSNIFKQAKMMQEKMAQIQEEMGQKKVTASSGVAWLKSQQMENKRFY